MLFNHAPKHVENRRTALAPSADQQNSGMRARLEAPDVTEVEIERDEEAVSSQRHELFFSRQDSGIGYGRANVLHGEGRVVLDDLFRRKPLGQIVEDDGDHDPGAADARLPVAYLRIYLDSLSPIRHLDSPPDPLARRIRVSRVTPPPLPEAGREAGRGGLGR
jgi:hypothetical protein